MRRATQIGLIGLALVLPTYYLLVVEVGAPFQLAVSELLFPWTSILMSADAFGHSNDIMRVAGLLLPFLQFPVYVAYLIWANRERRIAVALCTLTALHLLALSANYTMTCEALKAKLAIADNRPDGELYTPLMTDITAKVKPGMSKAVVLRELGQPRKHYRSLDVYDRRHETNVVYREVEYWEYGLIQPSKPIAVILSTNGVVEKITEDTDPIVIQL